MSEWKGFSKEFKEKYGLKTDKASRDPKSVKKILMEDEIK